MPKQKGFSSVLVIIVVVLILSFGGVFLLTLSYKNSKNQQNFQPAPAEGLSENKEVGNKQVVQNPDEPPLKIKNIGVNLDYYDPKTQKAGDFEFTKNKLVMNRIWMDYGYVIPANMSATSKDKSNPQPTFLLPMGTKVRALVDGIVVDIPKLYSGDYSVMVAKDEKSPWRYETEHIINPVVKVGDKVSAGQVVAEVSPHDSAHNNGFGLVEIGILKGGGEGPPEHICPFAYLDPSIKEDIEKKLLSFYKSWEEYRGDNTLYPENYTVPGCLTLNPIEG